MKFLLMITLLSLGQASYANYAKDVCSEETSGTVCYPKCDGHADCSDPETGCYDAASEDMEGANWWTNMWRKTLGERCSVNANCESGNCGHDICDESDKDGNCTKTHNECVALKVCRKAEFGETINGSVCDEGLVPDMNGVCVLADVLEEDPNQDTEIKVDPQSCAMTVPSGYNISFRFNNYLIQLLDLAFNNIEFGDDADCLQVTKGIRHINKYTRTAREEYGKGILEGIKAQEAAFYAQIQNNVDMTKKDSVDMYMKSLEAIKKNHENYRAANEKLRKAYDDATQDLVSLDNYYFGFNWKKDAVGNDSANRTHAADLIGGGGARVAVRDGGKDYCRGRSPKMKNSWKRRYDIQDGVLDGYASYIHLPYNNYHKSVKRGFWMLDMPLPQVDGRTEMFKHFGTNASDGGVRANIRMKDDRETFKTAGYIPYLMNTYGRYVYRHFMNDQTLVGGMSANVKKVIEAFSGKLGADNEHRFRSYMEPSLDYTDVSEEDATKKYFIPKDAEKGQKYRINMALLNYLIETYNIVDKQKLTLNEKEKKQLMYFQKLMWDFRQRFFLVQFLYSGSRSKRHPVQQRGKFFNMFIKVFAANAKYAAWLNEQGHAKSLECLAKLEVKYQEAVKSDDVVVSGPSNYNGTKPKDKKTLDGKMTKYDTKCTGAKCSTEIGAANLALHTSGAGGVKDGSGGAGAGGNFAGAGMSTGSTAQAAIANYRKKKEAEFQKTATPAMKKAREEAKKFMSLALAAPAVMTGEAPPAAASSSGGGDSSSTAKSDTPTKDIGAVAALSPSGAAHSAPVMKDILMGDSKDPLSSEITPEHAEAMLNEVKGENYKSNEDDGIFMKISKTYMRAGLPRLLTKKAELKTTDHEKEAFDPSAGKKKKAE